MQVVLSRLSWRWLLAFTSFPCFVLLVFFVIAPESPRYLCVQNRISDATLVLERMAKTNRVALPPGVLTYHRETQLVDHGPQNGQHLPVRESDRTVDNAMTMSSKSGSGGIAALRKLFSRKLLRSTLLIWFVWFANSFAYYGLVLLTSQLSDANRRCKSAQKSEAHQKSSNLYKDVFITSLAGITYTYTCIYIYMPHLLSIISAGYEIVEILLLTQSRHRPIFVCTRVSRLGYFCHYRWLVRPESYNVDLAVWMLRFPWTSGCSSERVTDNRSSIRCSRLWHGELYSFVPLCTGGLCLSQWHSCMHRVVVLLWLISHDLLVLIWLDIVNYIHFPPLWFAGVPNISALNRRWHRHRHW